MIYINISSIISFYYTPLTYSHKIYFKYIQMKQSYSITKLRDQTQGIAKSV